MLLRKMMLFNTKRFSRNQKTKNLNQEDNIKKRIKGKIDNESNFLELL